jgi:hypothetical protein
MAGAPQTDQATEPVRLQSSARKSPAMPSARNVTAGA